MVLGKADNFITGSLQAFYGLFADIVLPVTIGHEYLLIRLTLPSPARRMHSELIKSSSVAGLVNGNDIRLLRRQISAICFEQPTQSVH